MHQALADKLRHHLAGQDVTWNEEGGAWSDEAGKQLLLAIDGPLTAQQVVDAQLRAREAGARLTLAHVGDATPVARRTAARFGIALLDAGALPAPPAPPAPAAAPVESAPSPVAAPEEVLIVAHDEPAPEVAHAEPDTPLPWDPAVSAPEVQPAHVEPVELLALPWIDEMAEAEALPAGRETRVAPPRPTTAPDWGLPWPRPTAPMDGLAKADPRLWHAPERIQAMREDLDRAGATSFGAVKPEGSAWLKRLHEFPAP